MRDAGISFVVQPAGIDESVRAGESPLDCAVRLAREKALAVFKTRPQDCVLGADTIVVVDGAILGKPCNAADAGRMLGLLSGRTHTVITGVCVVARVAGEEGSTESVKTASETTLVTMRELSQTDICGYIATGEPMDKAGAYAIQGFASRWITRVEGDYNNVVGLPVALVREMLRDARC